LTAFKPTYIKAFKTSKRGGTGKSLIALVLGEKKLTLYDLEIYYYMEDKNNLHKDIIHGYEIKKSILFENNRGFALAENHDAVSPFVTWQFTEDESGKRDYYWGHYKSDGEAAGRDYETRATEYKQDYGLSEKTTPEVYKYYSTQRPVDIGTFPKTQGGPNRFVNFDKREAVEHGRFMAWGYLEYSAPLTNKQVSDYELRPAPGNPDRRRMEEQAQVIGKWEQAHRVPEERRLTWWYPDFGVFVAKEFVTPEQLAERHGKIIEAKERAADKRAVPKPIAEQLAEAGKQVERGTEASTSREYER